MVKGLHRHDAAKRAYRGFGLVEIMVGLVIGLIAVLVIYQVYTVAEGFKRNTTAAGEAQQTGLFSAFILGMELGNAGAGFTAASQDLASCNDPGGGMPMRFAQYYRPLPVVVADSGSDNIPDTFVVNYSMSTTLASSAPLTAAAGAGASFQVQSPGGFHANDLVVAISVPGQPTATAPCPTSRITAVALTNDALGDVTLTQTPVDPPGGLDLTDGAFLVNLGPCNRVQKVMYSLKAATWDNKPRCDQGTPCVLYSTPLLDTQGNNCGRPANPFVGNPIAANIVNMKVQYGIDTDADPQRTLDTWVPAKTGSGSGNWDWATMMDGATLITQINQIKAVRIGIIVQGEQFDPSLGDYNWVMFDCAAANKASCPGRLSGTIAKQTNPPGNWRFRKYETVIPLRNSIWNRL